MKKKYKILFWVAEALLITAGAFLIFALMGYDVVGVALLALAALLGVYRLLYAYSRKNPGRAKLLARTLTALIAAGVLALGAVEYPIVSGARSSENPGADYVIVLGAGVNGTSPSLMLSTRLWAAKAYLQEYPDAKVVVSGGQGLGENITEAECMRHWLENAGIAPGRILTEDKSTSTLENLTYSFETIRADGGDPGEDGAVAIISNEFHLYRARYMARELGVAPAVFAAGTPYPVMRLNYYLREALAVLWMWIM